MKSAVKKCAKVKNPCRICLQSVTNKNGLQCKGACKKWAHYTCLNYTPGKIQDIKAGLIKVVCPCPNCNVAVDDKEHLTDPPFTCTYQGCPANEIPKCQSKECPVNTSPSQIPSPNSPPFVTPYPTKNIPQEFSPNTCGPDCAQSKEVFPDCGAQEEFDPRNTFAPHQMSGSKESQNSNPASPCVDVNSPSGRDNQCIPDCNEANAGMAEEDLGSKCLPARQISKQNLHSLGSQRSYNNAKSPSKSVSCSNLCDGEGNECHPSCDEETKTKVTLKSGDCKLTCSDSRLMSAYLKGKDDEKTLLCTIHELCSTVGHLSHQIKNLMCKMLDNIEHE